MAKLKLISVRLTEETVQLIDAWVDEHKYFNRSYVIDHILTRAMTCSSSGTLWNLIGVANTYEKGYVCRYEKDPSVLSSRSKVNFD